MFEQSTINFCTLGYQIIGGGGGGTYNFGIRKKGFWVFEGNGEGKSQYHKTFEINKIQQYSLL